MPFFLGAIDRDHVLKKEEVRRLKQELRRLESNKAEQERMRGTFFERAHSLIAEAVSVDLLPTNQQMPHSWQEVKEGLTAAINAKAEQAFPETQYTLELEKLFELQGDLRNKHRAISEEMAALRALKSGGQGFTHEATEQRTRLSSIGLLPAGEESISSVCPLCSSTLSPPAPNAEAIRANLQAIMHHLEGVSSDFPHIDKLIANAEAKQAEINAELRNLNSRILAIQKVNKRIEVIRDSNAKRALIQGRLGLYLETISDVKDAAEDNKEIELLRSRIQALEMSLADETLQERLDSVLSFLSKEMSDMARTLDLEHSIYPMRLDTNKLTVVADTENGPLPLERMGSGENWVSIHIITYLVLHRWFARKRLPVPNFIFFDQPTQAYFPPDVSDETVRNTDRESVMRMFRLISDEVKDAGFQVIVMEHADIQEDWYQLMITEKWWDGVRKLVPLDWIRNA